MSTASIAHGPVDIAASRECTCHPDDNPPIPCEHRYAFQDCVEAAVEGLLMASACPNCDGSGSYVRETPNGGCEQVQCQFCYEREAALKGEQS